MPLAPGPFLLAPQSNVAVQPGVYDFTDDALTLASEINSNLSGWDDFFDDLGLLAADPLDDLVDGPLDEIVTAISVGVFQSQLPDLDSVVTSYATADSQLSIAASFAPLQSWTDPPAPFVPPGSVLNLIPPVIPPGSYTPGTTSPVGSAVPTTPPYVQLLNLTRIGQTNFVVGDTFQIAALGKPGQDVTASATQDGETLPTADYGTLDGNGALGIQGVMGPDNVGAWHEDWFFDGVPVSSFNFLVTPANS